MIDLTGVHEIDQTQTPVALAVKAMQDHMPRAEFFREVATSIPATVPDADILGWNHGSCRVVGRIGGWSDWAFEQGMRPDDVDLSKIDYIGFYRQAVKNKHTGEVGYFYATIPVGSAGIATPGATFEIKDGIIPFDWDQDDLEVMARESFLKLQEMVAEFYNREAA